MANSVSTLLSKIKYDRKQTELTSANVARADVDGYTRKVAYAEKLILRDSVSGIKQSQISRVIDKVIQTQTRLQNSKVGKSEIEDSYYTRLSQLLGTKGDEASFIHRINQFSVKMTEVVSITDGNKKRETIHAAVTLANQMTNLSDQINDLRAQADADIATAITTLNANLESIKDYNQQIVSFTVNNLDTSNLEDERDLLIHNSTELCGIKVFDAANNNKTIALESGDVLATSISTFPLSYTPASYILPGDVLSPISTAAGINITSTFTSGEIAGLLELRDQILPDIQAELDELTRVVRDTTNALHNEGAAFAGDATLTGLNYVPGVAVPIDPSTTISGQGTLRIAVTDMNGTLLDYKDVPLTDGMSVGGLVSDINSATYGFSNIAGDFTVTQLPTGELQISSTANKCVAIGAAGTTKPTISASSTYDPTIAYGFSHFFGLNNLFDTDNQVVSSSAQVGIANHLKVRDRFSTNAANLSVGVLNNQVPPPSGDCLGLTESDTTIAFQIGDTLRRGNLDFLAAGALSVAKISATEYATRIMSLIQSDINRSRSTQEVDERIYEELTKLAQYKSGVDPSEEIIKIFELSTSQSITSKALNIVNSMDRDLMTTLTR
ncbi:FlgK family flagellar hook-associated protein [Candidatus Odyssella thessalonicensis]|uniref:FlgK family flagellar hook-associated protein n=1 Tax=Candidatus Odyssella thessalonicensis TaxID=84647 RepID=UPI000225B70C|nr:flagellar hook protein FlgK [Candidatus Odyssella thessalonicensis]